MFIHGQSDSDMYNYFLGLLASKLQDMDFQQLRLGINNEFVTKKSLAFCLEGTALLACTQPLKRNMEHCTRESAGLNSSQHNHFVHPIFGDASLTSCRDIASIDTAIDQF